MKRQIPFALVFIFGLFMVFQYFVPHESSEWAYEFLLDWIVIIGIFALALGLWSLFHLSVEKIRTRKPGHGYSYITLAGLFIMIGFGFTQRQDNAEWGFYLVWVFTYIMTILLAARTLAASSEPGKRNMFMVATLGFLAATILIAIFDNSWSFYFYTPEGLENTMWRRFFDFVMMPILATMFSLLAFFIASAAYRAFRARNLLATLLLIAALIVMLRFNPWFPQMATFSNWLMNVPNLAAQRAIVIGIGLGIVATALKVILGIERGYMGKG